jgi:flagella basal body P-ring formation protein FlgA
MPHFRSILALAATFAVAALPLRADPAAAGAPLAQDAFMSALTRDVSAHFNVEGVMQLELLRPWPETRVVSPNWTLSVLEYPQAPSSTMLLRCQVRDEAGVVVEATLAVHAALWRDAWVVRLPVTTGETFDPANLEPRRSDMLRNRDLLPASEGDRSYVFSRSVPVGRMLTWHDIARHPLVRRGDLVVVTAADGLLVVSMKALALENGAQGDTVTVRNTESRKEFTALVTDEDHVQIQF